MAHVMCVCVHTWSRWGKHGGMGMRVCLCLWGRGPCVCRPPSPSNFVT